MFFFFNLGDLFRKACIVLRAGGAGIVPRWVPGSPGWHRSACGTILPGHPACPQLALPPCRKRDFAFCSCVRAVERQALIIIISQLFYLLFRKCAMGIGTGAASR